MLPEYAFRLSVKANQVRGVGANSPQFHPLIQMHLQKNKKQPRWRWVWWQTQGFKALVHKPKVDVTVGLHLVSHVSPLATSAPFKRVHLWSLPYLLQTPPIQDIDHIKCWLFRSLRSYSCGVPSLSTSWFFWRQLI